MEGFGKEACVHSGGEAERLHGTELLGCSTYYGESCGGHAHRETEGGCGCEHAHGKTYHSDGFPQNTKIAKDELGGHCCGGHAHREAESGCGCEHAHGFSKQMIMQFGFSALFFAGGFAVLAGGFDVVLFQKGPFSLSAHVFLFVVSWAISGYGVLFLSLKNIVRGKIFDENFLMSIATAGAFVLGEWSEGAAVMLFYNLGELLQHAAVDRSRRSILNLMELRPEFARLYDSSGITGEDSDRDLCVDPATVKTGSLILVKPGEKIPLDGVITEGACELDTSSMTGESVPRNAEAGDTVLAGFVNLSGIIIIKTSAELKDSAASKMLELIEHAQNKKAKTEKFITSFAKIYTPIVTIGAVLISVLPPILQAAFFAEPVAGWHSFAPWVSRGLVFLVISCPCALVISVPLGYFGGIGRAAKSGILIKGADYIDALSKTKAVVFDKTGTLTKGVLKVTALLPARGFSKDELLHLAAVAERNSNHPIARAVRECAAADLDEAAYKKALSAEVQGCTEKAGQGLCMSYGGKTLLAGKHSFICKELAENLPVSGDEIGGSQVYLSYGNTYTGCLVLTDTLKQDAAEAITELKRLGIENIAMLTGDNEKSARDTAKELGITRFEAELLPHEKVARFETVLRETKAQFPKSSVVFVGDGINDAPVLAQADAGIAMGAVGSDAAIEAADAVLINDSPKLIAEAVRISRFTRMIVAQNIALAFAIKIGFLVLGSFGAANLWAAVFADVGVALLAVLNSMRGKKGVNSKKALTVKA